MKKEKGVRQTPNNKSNPEHIKPSTTHAAPSSNTKQRPKSIGKASFLQSLPRYSSQNLVDEDDLFGGDIVHLSFDCPRNLRDAFNQAVWAAGGTSCQVLRKFMVVTVEAQKYGKACLSNTLQPVNIETFIAPTFVKSRLRRVKVVEETEEVEVGVVELGSKDRCALCKGRYPRKVYVRACLHDDSIMWLCAPHFREGRLKDRFKHWKRVNLD